MQLPLEITFRNMAPSEAIEARIRQKAEKLDRFYEHIMACRVTVEAPHHHHHKGNIYRVRVDVTVPGGELVASREQDLDHAHEDVYVAVRDAFDAVVRQLEAYAQRRRPQDVKIHTYPQGRVDRLFPEQDYGLITTVDGREIYFHRNSLQDLDLDDLTAGTAVWFREEETELGPKAVAVWVSGPQEG